MRHPFEMSDTLLLTCERLLLLQKADVARV